MPIYAFKCTSDTCGHIFDALKPMKHRHSEICPKCGQMAERYWGGGGSPLIQFRSKHQPGRTGWARIDYASDYEKSKRKNRRDFEGG